MLRNFNRPLLAVFSSQNVTNSSLHQCSVLSRPIPAASDGKVLEENDKKKDKNLEPKDLKDKAKQTAEKVADKTKEAFEKVEEKTEKAFNAARDKLNKDKASGTY